MICESEFCEGTAFLMWHTGNFRLRNLCSVKCVEVLHDASFMWLCSHVNSVCGCLRAWAWIHVPTDHAHVGMCIFWVIWVTQLSFLWCGVDGDIVPPVSRALEYAGCLCWPAACSAFLALSYNGALEHWDVIKPSKLLQLEFHLSGKTSIPM